MSPNSASLEATTERLRELAPKVRSLLANGEAWLDSLPIPAWLKDCGGQIVMINEAYSRAYDVAKSDYIGRTDTARWPVNVASEFRKHDLAVMQTGMSMVFEEALGDDRPITVLKFPVTDGVRLLGVGGVVITDDRAAGIPRLTAQCFGAEPATHPTAGEPGGRAGEG